MTKRCFLATSRDSLSAAEGTIYTDSWDVIEASGGEARDLREVFGTEPEYVDAAASEWADWLSDLAAPSWHGIPLGPALRADLAWSALFPIARHVIAGALLAREGFEITIDLPAGTLVGDSVIAGAHSEGGRVEQVSGGRQLPLPISHKPVEHEAGASLQRYRALRAASPLISLKSRRQPSRTRIATVFYPSIEAVVDGLEPHASLALWPWALPPPRRAIELIAAGGICLDPNTPADAADLEACRIEMADVTEATTFEAAGIDVSRVIRDHVVPKADDLLRYALYRTAAGVDALAKTATDAVLVPFDIGLSAAPLVLAAEHVGIPTILVQHGVESSSIPGDKRRASHLLVWSRPVAERYDRLPGAISVVGAPMLEAVAGPPVAGRRRVLFLSYPVRHNMTCDSWMVSEQYVALLAKVVRELPAGVEVVGLKIHPSESPEHYRRVMGRVGLAVPLLAEGTLPDVLEPADMVLGPVSTGLAEAWAAGRTPVCINLSGRPMSPPFNGLTEVPALSFADEIVALIRRWHASEWSLPHPAPYLEAEIGQIAGATDATVETILEIAGG